MHASSTVAASAVISATPGALLGVLLTAGADAASVSLFDNATAGTGAALGVVKAPINTTVSWLPPGGQACANGIYATITGTTPSATIVYR